MPSNRSYLDTSFNEVQPSLARLSLNMAKPSHFFLLTSTFFPTRLPLLRLPRFSSLPFSPSFHSFAQETKLVIGPQKRKICLHYWVHENHRKNKKNIFCLHCCLIICPHSLPRNCSHPLLEVQLYRGYSQSIMILSNFSKNLSSKSGF